MKPNPSTPKTKLAIAIHKKRAMCSVCGFVFSAQRSTARYCSDRCRVKAQRPDPINAGAKWREDRIIVTLLASSVFGRLAPVKRSDKSKPVFGLIAPRSFVVAEINYRIPWAEPVTEAELGQLLKNYGFLDYGVHHLGAPPPKGWYCDRGTMRFVPLTAEKTQQNQQSKIGKKGQKPKSSNIRIGEKVA